MPVEFFVPGVPVPKGSAKAFYNKYLKRAVVMQDNAAKQKPWASAISLSASLAMGKRAPWEGGVSISLEFLFPRPKSHYGTGKNALSLRRSAPEDVITKPDLDKLVRCVLDALTGIVWRDDSQVVTVFATKSYAEPNAATGVRVSAAARWEPVK